MNLATARFDPVISIATKRPWPFFASFGTLTFPANVPFIATFTLVGLLNAQRVPAESTSGFLGFPPATKPEPLIDTSVFGTPDAGLTVIEQVHTGAVALGAA